MKKTCGGGVPSEKWRKEDEIVVCCLRTKLKFCRRDGYRSQSFTIDDCGGASMVGNRGGEDNTEMKENVKEEKFLRIKLLIIHIKIKAASFRVKMTLYYIIYVTVSFSFSRNLPNFKPNTKFLTKFLKPILPIETN